MQDTWFPRSNHWSFISTYRVHACMLFPRHSQAYIPHFHICKWNLYDVNACIRTYWVLLQSTIQTNFRGLMPGVCFQWRYCSLDRLIVNNDINGALHPILFDIRTLKKLSTCTYLHGLFYCTDLKGEAWMLRRYSKTDSRTLTQEIKY